jgi:hypothetical protein
MRSLSAVLVAGVVVSSSCGPPWRLLETGDTATALRAIWVSPAQTVYVAGDDGFVSRRTLREPAFQPVSMLDSGGGRVTGRRVLGVVGHADDDVYAWTSGTGWHGSGGSFSMLSPPTARVGGAEATSWAPTHMVVASADRVILVTRLADDRGSREVLMEGNSRNGFREGVHGSGASEEVTWAAGSPSTPLVAGDGSGLVHRRDGTQWQEVGRLPFGGVRKAAVTTDRLFVVTDSAVRAVSLELISAEETALRLDRRVEALCAFPSGRVAAVGMPPVTGGPVWVMEGERWTNLLVGTRETLWAVWCAEDGKIYAAGNNGMVVAEP